MRPDPHIVVQSGAVLWLALMASLLFVCPALGLPALGSHLQVIGAGIALALLIGIACGVVSQFEDDGENGGDDEP